MKKIVFGALFMLIACVAFGADVDGKWKAEMDMMGQSMTLNFTFKADGAKLTGTSGPEGMGPETAISEGKIDGKNISFVIVVEGMDMKINYKGTVEGSEIKLDMDMGMGEPMKLTLKKAK